MQPPEPTVRVSSKSNKHNAAAGHAAEKTSPLQAEAVTSPGPVAISFKDVVSARLPAPEPISGSDEASRLGITPLKEVEPKLLHRLPPSELPTVDVEELLAKTSPMELKDTLAALEAQADATRTALVGYQPDHPCRAATQEELVKQQAAIDKLKKKTPGGSVLIEQLRTAKQSHKEHAAVQRQRAKEGMDKAAERKGVQVKAIDDMMGKLTVLKQDLLVAYGDAAQAWADYQVKREAQWSSIMSEFDARIASIELQHAAEPNAVAVPGPSYALAPVPQPLPQQDIADPLLKAQHDAQVAYQKLAEAQAAHQRALLAKASAEQEAVTAKAAAQTPLHLMTFDGEASDLPSMVPEPLEEQWAQLHNLWTAIDLLNRQEAITGLQAPVTYAQLHSGLDIPELLLGSKVWAKAYPEQKPTLDTVVTIQLRRLMGISMEAHRAKLQADQTKQQAAKLETEAGITAAVDEYRSKKRRMIDDASAGAASSGASSA